MPPTNIKRRRGGEQEARPKKKIRVDRKAAARYHSSDEDSDDDAARDAPVRQPTKKAAATVKEDPRSAKKVASAAQELPKSILKKSGGVPVNAHEVVSESEASLDGSDDDDDEDVEDVDELALANADQAQDDEDEDEGEQDDEYDISSDNETNTSTSQRTKKKRQDASAFSNSLSKILSTNLTSSKRSDPVLSFSSAAAQAGRELADEKREAAARAQVRNERRVALEKGREKDVLGLATPDVDTGAVLVEEKRLKKVAQRGVVQLFNAVRAAQTPRVAEPADGAEKKVGIKQREELANDRSKEAFLKLISGGNKKTVAA